MVTPPAPRSVAGSSRGRFDSTFFVDIDYGIRRPCPLEGLINDHNADLISHRVSSPARMSRRRCINSSLLPVEHDHHAPETIIAHLPPRSCACISELRVGIFMVLVLVIKKGGSSNAAVGTRPKGRRKTLPCLQAFSSLPIHQHHLARTPRSSNVCT